jgi:hypothetical protein
VRLANPRWRMARFGLSRLNDDFEVEYEFVDGRPAPGAFLNLKWRYPDGNTGSASMASLFQARGSIQVHIIGIGAGLQRTGALEIWVEENHVPGPFGGAGKKVSNSVTLR